MASLLDMVDALIGNVLKGNLYTNEKNYSDILKTMESNLPSPTSNPAQTIEQQTSTQKTVNIPQFLNPVVPSGITAAETSPDVRNLFYKQLPIPEDVQQQLQAQVGVPDNVLIPSELNFKQGNANSDVRDRLASKLDVQETKSIPQPLGLFEKYGSTGYKGGNTYDDGGITLVQQHGGPYHEDAFIGPLEVFDVFAIAHWFRNIERETALLPRQHTDPISGISKNERSTESIQKGISWLASQFLLTSFNSGDSQAHGLLNMVWNPLSLPASLIPGLRGLSLAGITPTGITIGALAGTATYQDNVRLVSNTPVERLLLMRSGIYSRVSPVENISKLNSPISPPGFIGNTVTSDIGGGDTLDLQQNGNIPSGLSTIDMQLGGIGETGVILQSIHTNTYTADRPYGTDGVMPQSVLNFRTTPQQDKLQTLYKAKAYPGSPDSLTIDTGTSPKGYTFINKVGLNPLDLSSFAADNNDDLPGLGSAVGNIDAALDPSEQTDGTIVSSFSDNHFYMPFMFQDLREDPPTFLYFRAFLKPGTAETFAPEWQTERFYGRVDHVPTYQGTTRTISLAFDVVAFKRSDLDVIYQKVKKLQSMVYPEYDQKGFLNKGPLVRMRVGDLIAGDGGKGLPGYISSLDFTYDDGIWEIDPLSKVPRKISVSLSFVVIHEGNPGIYPYTGATIGSDSSVTNPQIARTFGAATFTTDSSNNTTVAVSVADIRRMFDINRQ